VFSRARPRKKLYAKKNGYGGRRGRQRSKLFGLCRQSTAQHRPSSVAAGSGSGSSVAAAASSELPHPSSGAPAAPLYLRLCFCYKKLEGGAGRWASGRNLMIRNGYGQPRTRKKPIEAEMS
jgi:hypothetical protein